MRRGTTPTYILDLSQVDTSRIADICLAFEQDGNELNLHMSEGRIEIGETSGYATLTQEETNAFAKGRVRRQVKVKFDDGTVRSTDIEKETVYDVIHEEVL